MRCVTIYIPPGSSRGTNFGGAQDDAESSFRYPRSDARTHLAIAKPTRSEPPPYSERPLWAGQPLEAVNNLDLEQAEIPESPSAIQGCLAVSIPSRHPSDGDDGGGSAAITAITETVAVYTEEDSSVEEQQDQVKAEQEGEGTIGDGGRFPPSRQPEAPILTSTVRVLESSLVSTRHSPEFVQGH